MRLRTIVVGAALLIALGQVRQEGHLGGLKLEEDGRGTAESVADLARRAGFPEDTIATAVAKSGCESGMNPQAIGDTTITDTTWGPSVGVWQIRSTWEDTFTFGQRSAFLLLSPSYNAKIARELSRDGRDWRLWSC